MDRPMMSDTREPRNKQELDLLMFISLFMTPITHYPSPITTKHKPTPSRFSFNLSLEFIQHTTTMKSSFVSYLAGIIMSSVLLVLVANPNNVVVSAVSLPFFNQKQHHSLLPYKLGVRDSLMIAHSFHNHPSFGPAGGMHGATYTCDVEFASSKLVQDTNWVIDIGLASDIVSSVLSKYNLQNMDEVFPNGELTTTEFMAKQIHTDICTQLQTKCKDFNGSLCIKLWESHKAWASYEGNV